VLTTTSGWVAVQVEIEIGIVTVNFRLRLKLGLCVEGVCIHEKNHISKMSR